MSTEEHDRLQRWVRLPVPPDRVWREIGGFGRISEWHPWVDSTELVELEEDLHRHMRMVDGELFLDRLLKEGERYYTYSTLEGLPVDDHRATLSCVPEEGGCHVFWSAYFVPTDRVADEMVIAFYEAGLDAIRDRFGEGSN